MAKSFLTDAQVEEEIARLTTSPYVKLAREQERIKYQRRQYLYTLRNLEKKGKALYDKIAEVEDAEDIENIICGLILEKECGGVDG